MATIRPFIVTNDLQVNGGDVTTLSAGSATLFNTNTLDVSIAGAATTISIGASSSTTTIAGNLVVNGLTTTINSTTITVDDKNIELGSVSSPTEITANGGGITLRGTTDKTIAWLNATSAWTSSEHWDLTSSKEYRIGGTSVLTSTKVLGRTPAGTTAGDIVTIDATQTLTNKSLTAPRITTGSNIADANGNELISFPAVVASAVNEITISNAISGSAPTIEASGADTNINLSLKGKGTGSVNIGAVSSNIYLGTQLALSGGTLSLNTTTQTTVDSFSATTFRSSEYLVQITQGSAYQISKVLLVHDGSSVYMTEYGTVTSGNVLGTLDADINSGNVRLLVTMESATSAVVKTSRVSLVV